MTRRRGTCIERYCTKPAAPRNARCEAHAQEKRETERAQEQRRNRAATVLHEGRLPDGDATRREEVTPHFKAIREIFLQAAPLSDRINRLPFRTIEAIMPMCNRVAEWCVSDAAQLIDYITGAWAHHFVDPHQVNTAEALAELRARLEAAEREESERRLGADRRRWR